MIKITQSILRKIVCESVRRILMCESQITTDIDKVYMDAVNRGDMDTAQRMVIKAAKAAMPNTKVVDENGMPLVVYRGEMGNDKQFTVFDRDVAWEQSQSSKPSYGVFWLTTNRDVANGYASPDASQNERGDNARGFFLNVGRLYEVDAKGEYFNSVVDRKLHGYRVGADVIATLARDAGYDGVLFRNIKDGATFEDMDVLQNTYAVFGPNQIKSADPVTYDGQGNVIPLSERFNLNNNDIRYEE